MTKKTVLITGANGMLAQQLAKQLADNYSIRFLTRKVTQKNEYLWNLENKYIDPKALMDVNYIVHLAGASLADKRWSDKRKRVILSSRIDSAQLILDELQEHKISIDAFISASAIGYYGTLTTDTIFKEDCPKGSDFLSDVCHQWENQAHLFQSKKAAKRVSIVRIGIILSKDGGALKKIVQPIRYGFGSAIGKGHQYMPWIHIQDLCGIIQFLVANESINGTFNAVSPEHTTNIELTKEVGKTLGRKILLPNIPSFIFQVIFGEMSILLLEGSRVSSDKITKMGYDFKYKKLSQALSQILG